MDRARVGPGPHFGYTEYWVNNYSDDIDNYSNNEKKKFILRWIVNGRVINFQNELSCEYCLWLIKKKDTSIWPRFIISTLLPLYSPVRFYTCLMLMHFWIFMAIDTIVIYFRKIFMLQRHVCAYFLWCAIIEDGSVSAVDWTWFLLFEKSKPRRDV